jgi:hypothetical protein
VTRFPAAEGHGSGRVHDEAHGSAPGSYPRGQRARSAADEEARTRNSVNPATRQTRGGRTRNPRSRWLRGSLVKHFRFRGAADPELPAGGISGGTTREGEILAGGRGRACDPARGPMKPRRRPPVLGRKEGLLDPDPEPWTLAAGTRPALGTSPRGRGGHPPDKGGTRLLVEVPGPWTAPITLDRSSGQTRPTGLRFLSSRCGPSPATHPPGPLRKARRNSGTGLRHPTGGTGSNPVERPRPATPGRGVGRARRDSRLDGRNALEEWLASAEGASRRHCAREGKPALRPRSSPAGRNPADVLRLFVGRPRRRSSAHRITLRESVLYLLLLGFDSRNLVWPSVGHPSKATKNSIPAGR